MPYSFSIIENFDPALVNYHMLWVKAGVNSLLLGVKKATALIELAQ